MTIETGSVNSITSQDPAPAADTRPLSRPASTGGLFGSLRAFGRRHRVLITVVGSLVTAAVLVLVLAGRRHEFETALWSAAPWMLAPTALLQIVALVARSEAWHLTIEAAGGTVDRRVLLPRVEHAGAGQLD